MLVASSWCFSFIIVWCTEPWNWNWDYSFVACKVTQFGWGVPTF